MVKGSLLDLLSEQSSLSHPSMATIWSDICTNCDLGIGTLATLAASRLPGQHDRLRRMLGERVLRVTVKPFMDMNTMIEERLTQCCVHVATVNGDTGAHQCAPFCAVQAWAPLSETRISTAVGLAAGGRAMSDPRQVQPPRLEDSVETSAEPPFDPLKLCVFATVALLGWLLGPWALLGFAVLAVVGYATGAAPGTAALEVQAGRHPAGAALPRRPGGRGRLRHLPAVV